jgi:formylglycine-generating enzyme
MAQNKAFLSYAHQDNKDGRITQFREHLEALIKQFTGQEFSIFQDKQIDTGDIWEKRIIQELDDSSVLIAILTPTFFNRDWCRREVKTFLDKYEKAGVDPILIPIYWLNTPLINTPDALKDHPIASRVVRHQYDDWTKLFRKSLSDDEVRSRLIDVAEKIIQKVEQAKPFLVGPAPKEPEPLTLTPKPVSTVRPRVLTPTARLDILSAPPGAVITVNGTLLTESFYEAALPTGILSQEIEVIVSASGYIAQEWDITLVAGTPCPLDATLIKLPVAVVKPRTPAPLKPKVFTPPLTIEDYTAQMIPIPAGEFLRGSDALPDQTPQTKITLKAFSIGIVPVTVAMYEEFCKTGKAKMPDGPSFDPKWEKKTHPMVNLTWDEAKFYATANGLLLPSEAQWERAARGTDGREYPWGKDWDSTKCQCSKSTGGDSGGTAPVGSYPGGASPDGVLDMAGNVWEWCEDWYQEDWYSKAAKSDPPGPEGGEYRVLRGGSWRNNVPAIFRCAYRNGNRPGIRSSSRGLRLVSPGPLP